LIAIETTERGYRPESVLTMMVDPLDSEYPTPTALLGFLDAIEREVEAAPGVRAVGWTSTLPMGDSMTGDVTFEVIGAPLLAAAERPVAEYHVANPSYFDTVDVPLVEGRLFTVFDTIDAAPLALVNETFARRYLPGRSPVGARLILRGANAPPDVVPTIREVVGVVGDVRRRPDQTEAAPQIYAPMSQTPQGDVYLVVRADAGPADALTGAIRAAIATVDRAQLVSVRDIETLDAVAGAATGRYRFRATLVMTFAGLALLLAMVGVFGILAYSVQQQSGDFAVRRALGATARDVVRLVVTSVAKVVVVGTIVGLLLAAALGRLLTAVLFGVEPLDATTFVAVVALLALRPRRRWPRRRGAPPASTRRQHCATSSPVPGLLYSRTRGTSRHDGGVCRGPRGARGRAPRPTQGTGLSRAHAGRAGGARAVPLLPPGPLHAQPGAPLDGVRGPGDLLGLGAGRTGPRP
jgi:putative ABC transport system permease protein